MSRSTRIFQHKTLKYSQKLRKHCQEITITINCWKRNVSSSRRGRTNVSPRQIHVAAYEKVMLTCVDSLTDGSTRWSLTAECSARRPSTSVTWNDGPRLLGLASRYRARLYVSQHSVDSFSV